MKAELQNILDNTEDYEKCTKEQLAYKIKIIRAFLKVLIKDEKQ